MDKKYLQFVATRIINDVDKKLPFPNKHLFDLWCQMYYDKEISNIQFKKGLKKLQQYQQCVETM